MTQVGKMAALHIGVDMALGPSKTGPILFTDADTLVGCRWAARMRRHLQGDGAGRPTFVSSSAVAWHGPSRTADSLHTFHQVLGHARVSLLGRAPGARGYNMGVNMTPDMHDAYMSLDPKLFGGEDSAVRDLVAGLDGKLVATTHPDSIVLTRGDRFTSVQEYLDWWKHPNTRHRFYQEIAEFGLTPYVRLPPNSE